MHSIEDLSSEARQTRQHIYETAMNRFRDDGYDTVTMNDIAHEADILIDEVYRYFARKEDIVLVLYHDMVTQWMESIESLPNGQMADRYHAVLTRSIDDISPFRSAMMALFGIAMRPDSGISLMGTDRSALSRKMCDGYHQLVLASDDALKEAKAEQMGVTLYTFHMLIILFWIYDRSPQQDSTHKLLHFVHELFKMLRPLFFMPMIPQAIGKLAKIVMPDTQQDEQSNDEQPRENV